MKLASSRTQAGFTMDVVAGRAAKPTVWSCLALHLGSWNTAQPQLPDGYAHDAAVAWCMGGGQPMLLSGACKLGGLVSLTHEQLKKEVAETGWPEGPLVNVPKAAVTRAGLKEDSVRMAFVEVAPAREAYVALLEMAAAAARA